MAKESNSSVNQLGKLDTDSSLVGQPQGTTRFALNAVNESDEGDIFYRSNEESNYECYEFPKGFVPIGDVYIGNGNTMIFLASEEGNSIIGIADKSCNFSIEVDDSNQNDKLGFKITSQIEASYRLRRGCETTVYWVDPKPRRYVVEKPEEFKKENGEWEISKFNLVKTYSKIPEFSDIEVLDSGGVLESGSINVSIQLVDEDLNPTEWITTTRTAKIYNDISSRDFSSINGSINSPVDYINFPRTGKALRVEVSNLDDTFLFYRLAFITSDAGTGRINKVIYSENIPISQSFFIYTGENGVTEGTPEEIALFSEIIKEAGQITQLENMLVLGETKSKQIDYCRLQKYASKIKADCILKPVVLNDITDPSNPKNPTQEISGIGYMPGEIYSFGIVWVFAEDGSTTPVAHIPGKSPNIDPTTVFSPGENVYPMSNENNECQSTFYFDNDTCGTNSFWGRDCDGVSLLGKKVRHHRFPLRSEIEVPLVTTSDGENQTYPFYSVRLRIKGTLIVPLPCDPEDLDCDTDSLPSFEVRVTYVVNGEEFTFSDTVDPDFYSNGVNSTYNVDIYQDSQYHGTNAITITAIEITDLTDTFVDASTFNNSVYFQGGDGIFTTEIVNYESNIQGRTHTSMMYGIKFSGIEKPSLEDTGGHEVIGYYIVRNERTEFDKTIVDSGVFTPSVINEKYIGNGLLNPDTTKISEDVFGLIHPEHKFLDKEYTQYDRIIQEGTYDIVNKKYGKINYDDVFDGTSYNSSKQKSGNDDGHGRDYSPNTRGLDGWSLNIISRDNIAEYRAVEKTVIEKEDIKERFYLNALENKMIDDNAKDVYNIAADNKIGIVQLDNNKKFESSSKLPYALLYKDNAEPYSNFRVLPYYKDSKNMHTFDEEGNSETSVFGGDTYISSMRYVNTIFWDNRVAKRAGKRSALKIVLGAFLIVAGVLLNIIPGLGQVGSAIAISAGVVLIGGGALYLSSGIKQATFNKAYNEEYAKGLRQTALDNFTDMFYNYKNTIPFGFFGNGGTGGSGPSDDTIQWVGDCITDLWFESAINTNLRHKFVDDVTPTFLDSPSIIEDGNNSPIGTWEYFGLYYTDSNAQRYPVSALEKHLARKLLVFDPERDDNRYYLGAPLGEYYKVNPDYMRKNKEKIYNHLPFEYDCCSDCNEEFPQRIHYSVQAFQEELTDNFRVFLPNNYKDIEGETGRITALYRIQNNLYIHTEEALWHLPQNVQERVTGEVVSFIGTGEYFNIPPRKIVDDANSSAGCSHKWGITKTKYGIVFPSHKEKKWYLFNGETLKPLTAGNENWFKENMKFQIEEAYYNTNRKKYPYLNNPSNKIGVGYLSVYDSKKERLILTKKDKILTNLPESPYEICSEGDQVIIFENFNTTIAQKEAEGFTFLGLENCKLKFSKSTYVPSTEERQITSSTTIPNDSNIYAFFDTSGSFDSGQLNIVRDAVQDWYDNLVADGFTGNYYPVNDVTERWLNYASSIPAGGNVLVLSFVNKSHPIYHTSSYGSNIEAPSPTYIADFNNFVNNVYPNFTSFAAIAYPIHTANTADSGRNFIRHTIAAIYGRDLSAFEANSLEVNSAFSTAQWDTLKTSLLDNPYKTVLDTNGNPGLRDYNWVFKSNVNDLGRPATDECEASSEIITPCQLAVDINELLEDIIVVQNTTIEVDTLVEEVEIVYVEGEILETEEFIDSGNTISYSLKEEGFVSWHSYIPSYYFHDQERFFSWKEGINKFWKHNRKGHYQTFYGVKHPFVLEFVDNQNPLNNKIWDYLMFQTEAKIWNQEYEEYVDTPVTFNKFYCYNTHQISGMLNLVPKTQEEDYLLNQIQNSADSILIDRNERDWTINEFRDLRVNYNVPMFIKKIALLQSSYFTDKEINPVSIDFNKDWTQKESFRDKFLVFRLIFDNFDNVRLTMNYTIQNPNNSER